MVWWIHKMISAQGIVIYIESKNDSPAIQEGTAAGLPFAPLLKNASGLANVAGHSRQRCTQELGVHL